MLSRFFINRPVFATVIALLIMVLGFLCLPRLEISRFPNIAPPSIRLTLKYNGASALTMENSVVQVVEQQMSGLDGLLYFSSTSTSSGEATLSFSFDQKVDPDVAQMQIQNRLQNIMSRLPQAVQDNGFNVRKVSEDTLQRIAFYCDDGSMQEEDIADFVSSVLQDSISRLDGVGAVNVFGSSYAIRVWLNLEKMASYKLNPEDIVNVITTQNRQLSSGQLGALPNHAEEPLNITIKSREMLSSLEDFEKIVVKAFENGATILLKDVARIEMGRESYVFSGSYNHYPFTVINIDLTDGANAVETAQRIEKFLKSYEDSLPEGMKYAIPYDTVPYVKASLEEIFETFLEALVLVALVILLFLKDLRATLIVCMTIPIVLFSTISVLYVLGYSINTLTLFAMVLSIGLLVDDAIVVVENISRLMQRYRLNPHAAAIRSMEEISSALFGVGLVIAAVFVPMSFFSGATGKIYQQFSVTIVCAMLFSIVVALIITPSWCAALLKDPQKKQHMQARSLMPFDSLGSLQEKVNAQDESKQEFFYDRAGQESVALKDEECQTRTLNDKKRAKVHAIFDVVPHLMEAGIGYFLKTVDVLLHHIKACLLFTLGLVLLSYVLFKNIPSSFLPNEDQGILFTTIVMPSGTPMTDTTRVAHEVRDYFEETEGENIEGVMVTLGNGAAGARGQSVASVFVKLKDWSLRPAKSQSAVSIRQRVLRHFKNHSTARINVNMPGMVRGMGPASGFRMQVQNIYGYDREVFLNDVKEMVDVASLSPMLTNVRMDTVPDSPELILSIDDREAMRHHISSATLNNNLSIALAGKYVNDFIDRGRIKRVYVQADAEYRTLYSDLYKISLCNQKGELVPLSGMVKASYGYGPVQSQRFNGISAIPLAGDPMIGASSGEAMAEMARIVMAHPHHYNYAWYGQSYQEMLLGSQTVMLFTLSALIVFLVLAALYESWVIPLAVVFIIPFGLLGALLLVYIRDLYNDVYLQIGLLTSGGLAAKNAILLIEYAHKFTLQGYSLLRAARMAAQIRFRPIIMTSVAFLLGVMPLMFANGAGAQSQISIGTAIVGGTLLSTFLGAAFIPGFYVMVVHQVRLLKALCHPKRPSTRRSSL